MCESFGSNPFQNAHEVYKFKIQYTHIFHPASHIHHCFNSTYHVSRKSSNISKSNFLKDNSFKFFNLYVSLCPARNISTGGRPVGVRLQEKTPFKFSNLNYERFVRDTSLRSGFFSRFAPPSAQPYSAFACVPATRSTVCSVLHDTRCNSVGRSPK